MSSSYTPQPAAFETAAEYARQAVSGAIVVCEYVRLACQRFLDDLDHGIERGLYFDKEAAQHAVDYFGFFKHVKGEWARRKETAGFVLSPWQVFIVANLFGWFHLETGLRRFREAHLELARKNGKSTFIAGIGLYMLHGDGEPGAEVWSAATTKEQAHIVFDVAWNMVKKSPGLASRIQTSGTPKRPMNLHVIETVSKFGALAADATNLDGLNVHCGLIDELHEHPTRALYDVINTGTGSRSQPLVIAITTAGFDREGICWDQRKYGIQVVSKIVVDDSFFAFVATLDKGDRWDDQSKWIKANPNLGVSTTLDAILPNFKKAKEQPAALNEFLRKHLNVWTSSDTSYIPPDVWAKCCVAGENAEAKPLREQAIERNKGRLCFGGLDIGEVSDFSALGLVFPPCGELTIPKREPGFMFMRMLGSKEIKYLPETNAKQLIAMHAAEECDEAPPNHPQIKIQEASSCWDILTWIWVPEAYIDGHEKKDRAPLAAWASAGFIEKTPGNAVDEVTIKKQLRKCKELYRMKEVGYDPWGMQTLGPALIQEGFPMVKMTQNMENLSAPCKALAEFAKLGVLEHFNNPVLRWMISCAEIQLDGNGSQKIHKGKSKNRGKVDAVVAIHMALGRALLNPQAKDADNPDRYRVKLL